MRKPWLILAGAPLLGGVLYLGAQLSACTASTPFDDMHWDRTEKITLRLPDLTGETRFEVCLRRCDYRQQVKPDNSPLSCAERCAGLPGAQ